MTAIQPKQAGSKKLVLILSNNSNDDKSTVAMTIANAALLTGMEVGVFLTSDGVELSRDRSCDFTSIKPFKPLNELMDGFIDQGGVLWTCAPCFHHRGLEVEDTLEGSVVTGAGPMLEWVAAGASTICL